MDDETSRQLKSIERRIDDEYATCVPGLGCWEADAVHLLMAHELACVESDPRLTADAYKYPLMHGMRWAAKSQSSPTWQIPSRITEASLDCAQLSLSRASEYVSICGAFWKAWAGVIAVEKLGDCGVTFGGNSAWLAFDVLDARLNEGTSDRDALKRLTFAIRKAASRTKTLSLGRYLASHLYAPDLDVLQQSLRHIESSHRHSELLPDGWRIRESSLEEFRPFWNALRALAFLHLAVTSRRIPALQTSRLLILTKADLIQWISKLSTFDDDTVARLLSLHVYDPLGNTPDIALNPFVNIGANTLVASPSLLWTLAYERNLCAFLARASNDEFSASTSNCAKEMAIYVRDQFRGQGYLAEINIDICSSDIDVLVWSPDEQFLLSLELRWLIPTADVSEVINRGEKQCLEKLRIQLPKHEIALRSNGEELIAQVFGRENVHPIVGHGSMLVMRGYVGSSRMKTAQFAFCDDRLLIQQLGTGCSLRELFDWCRSMPYLPQDGKDFHLEAGEIITPSGIQIVHREIGVAELSAQP